MDDVTRTAQLTILVNTLQGGVDCLTEVWAWEQENGIKQKDPNTNFLNTGSDLLAMKKKAGALPDTDGSRVFCKTFGEHTHVA